MGLSGYSPAIGALGELRQQLLLYAGTPPTAEGPGWVPAAPTFRSHVQNQSSPPSSPGMAAARFAVLPFP